MYPRELVEPMVKELTEFGFVSMTSPQEVVQNIENMEGTALLVVNSVCGCAAGNARPGAKMSLSAENSPNHLWTVFAGFDKEATEKAREYLLPFPPSSPAIALFKDGKLVHMIERRNIEGRTAQMIASELVQAYEKFPCTVVQN